MLKVSANLVCNGKMFLSLNAGGGKFAHQNGVRDHNAAGGTPHRVHSTQVYNEKRGEVEVTDLTDLSKLSHLNPGKPGGPG